MNRRNFFSKASLAALGTVLITKDLYGRTSRKAKTYGHNGMTYTLDTAWCKTTADKHPVNDCHEMVQDAKGRIILLTNEVKNNILIFNTSGKLLEYWGDSYPGAHGLTLWNDTLFITDTAKHRVFKTSMKGENLITIDGPPLDAGIYTKKDEFVPTEVAVASNGDFFIADGYGAQYILHYNAKGEFLNYFGGRGPEEKHLDNAHGICIDYRKGTPTLLVTDRTRNCFKRFDMEGKLLEVIQLPGACVCRPVIKGDHLYAAVLRSPDLGAEGTGFVTILDKNNAVVSNIGGSAPEYENGALKPLKQTDKIFVHPHDVCIDRDENIYVAQWASGKVYPYKLTRA